MVRAKHGEMMLTRLRVTIRSFFLIGMVLFLARGECSAKLPRVLYINSYHPGMPWSDSLEQGINNGLDGVAELHVEYLYGKHGSVCI